MGGGCTPKSGKRLGRDLMGGHSHGDLMGGLNVRVAGEDIDIGVRTHTLMQRQGQAGCTEASGLPRARFTVCSPSTKNAREYAQVQQLACKLTVPTTKLNTGFRP